mmetsp:Transcript_7747/g.10701  ORF Transcript_7747/g.10701 Transcript_7747/m.10701 type:complete len:196 (-) Transcript_7747:46-633(-)
MSKSNKNKRKNEEQLAKDEKHMQEFDENPEVNDPSDEDKDEDQAVDQQASSEDESDEDEELPQTKKAKSEPKSFGAAVSTILGRYEQNKTVLPLSKSRKAMEEQRKRQQLAEKEAAEKEMKKNKQQLANKTHVVPEVLNTTEEHKLKKIATLGVVQLFNAIAKHQSEASSEGNVQVANSKKNFMEALKSQSKSSL